MLINNQLFLEKEIPRLHPLTQEYASYWIEQRRRCIDGYWVGGKFMPGPLYFYCNFGTILKNKTKNSKNKILARPELWDIHWDIFYGWLEARGFSGFQQQEVLLREDLYNTTKNLGKPLYENDAKNMTLLSSRDTGKSYNVANGVIAHEFLFNGCKDSDDKDVSKVDILVGAGEAKFSTELLKKVKICLDNLPGAMQVGEVYYPAPFSKRVNGSLTPGKDLVQSYQKKIGGQWIDVGTKSTIKHRTFSDNPHAGAGERFSVVVLEEVGFFNNLMATHETLVDTMKNASSKFGSAFYLGTGGSMESGTVDISKMFYDPYTFDMVAYDDIWENKGKICMFIPEYLGNRFFKDDQGNTDIEAGKKIELAKREALRKGKNSASALDSRLQYHPLVPSEIFLTKNSNIFPKAELQAHLGHLETNPIYRNAEYIGDLVWGVDNKIEWKLNPSLRPILDFPLDHKKDDIEGSIVIWEHPFVDEYGNIPHGLYLAGTDPYDHDESGTPSLGSTFIYKRYYSNDQTYETIVAEYTGRPKADTYYANLIKLLLYYNARCLYENEKKGLHQYAAQKNYDYLLMDQPQYIKDVIANSKVNRVKGMHMNESLKVHGETLIKNWLEEEYSPGKLQLTKIRSIPLIKELIQYNRKEGNYDRVMSFMCTMYAIQERLKLSVQEVTKVVEIYEQDFFNKPLFTKNRMNFGNFKM